jgi:hypothetical protein
MTGMEAFPDIGTVLRLCCDFVAAYFKRPFRRHFMWHECNMTPCESP